MWGRLLTNPTDLDELPITKTKYEQEEGITKRTSSAKIARVKPLTYAASVTLRLLRFSPVSAIAAGCC